MAVGRTLTQGGLFKMMRESKTKRHENLFPCLVCLLFIHFFIGVLGKPKNIRRLLEDLPTYARGLSFKFFFLYKNKFLNIIKLRVETFPIEKDQILEQICLSNICCIFIYSIIITDNPCPNSHSTSY